MDGQKGGIKKVKTKKQACKFGVLVLFQTGYEKPVTPGQTREQRER